MRPPLPKFTPQTAQSDSETDGACGPYTATLYSDSGGLTQFGAFVETLPPGSRSALKHWHTTEDEMIYMISGQALVHEGDDTYPLLPGEAATFKAGAPVGHCLENASDGPISYLVIGTRSDGDTVSYPDHDRVLRFARAGGKIADRQYTTLAGAPSTSPYKD